MFLLEVSEENPFPGLFHHLEALHYFTEGYFLSLQS